jgi:hypothetical protein
MTTSIGRNSGSTATPTKATFSYWLKGKEDGTAQGIWGWHRGNDAGNYWLGVYYSTNGSMYFNWKQGSFTCTLGTTQKFRDPSAWGHHVISIDTTLGTASDRVKWYINGERVTSFEDGLDTITQNSTLLNWSNAQDKIEIGTWYQASTAKNLNNHLLSHFHFTDGYAYQASDFGSTDSTSGQWKINTSPSVTYGNEGFFILKDGNTITDSSTNSNNFSLDGGTLTKTEDCPDNNFATMNPLDNYYSAATFSNGNNTVATAAASVNWVASTLQASSGKWYAECKPTAGTASALIGFAGSTSKNNTQILETAGFFGGNYVSNGEYFFNGSGGAYASSFANGDIISVYLDLDNNFVYFAKNGALQYSGDPTSGATGTGGKAITAAASTTNGSYAFACGDGNTATRTFDWNFGNGYFGTTAVTTNSGNGYAAAEGKSIFNYQPPTGYSALSTKGLNN